jgi:hypothetical protein
MPPTKKNCPECGEELWAMHLPGHLFHQHGIGERPGSAKRETAAEPEARVEEPNGRETVADVLAAVEAPPGIVETAPRKPKLMDRLRSRRGRGGRGGQHSAAPVPGERAPKRKRPAGKRVSLDSDISDIWGFAGRRLEGTAHFATGRMLEYQAPAAGLILDRAVAGTLPDRVFFQPLARNRDKYEDVAFLLAGPLLTFSITTTQLQMQAALDAGDQAAFEDLAQKVQMQREMFVWVASMMLPRLAEGVERAREKKAKTDAAIAQAFPDLAGEDPIETFATMLFTPPNFTEASQNGRHEASHAATSPGGEGPLFE